MFYNILVELLQKNSITAYKLAKDTGISQGLMGEYKSGKKIPTQKNLQKIADYFGVSVDYLLGNDNVKVYDDNDNIVVIDDETRDIIDSLRKRPEMNVLFSVSKKATKKDIEKAVAIIEALRDTEK